MASVVCGGARGIGAGMVRELLARTSGPVVVISRDPKSSAGLVQMQSNHPSRLFMFSMDAVDEHSVKETAQRINEEVGRVHVLVNCIGILHDQARGFMPERNLDSITPEWLLTNFQINTLAPTLVIKHFGPRMAITRGSKVEGIPPLLPAVPVLATLSARVGSISDNRLGGWYSYRMTKAAQNQLTRTASLELKRSGVVCMALHPGTVESDLSQPFAANVKPDKLFTVEHSASQLTDRLLGATLQDSGKFFAYDGQLIPW